MLRICTPPPPILETVLPSPQVTLFPSRKSQVLPQFCVNELKLHFISNIGYFELLKKIACILLIDLCTSFQARCWHACITRSVELTQVHRQKDKQFIALLQNVRIGRCPPAISSLLTSTQHQDIERDGLRATKLCTHKEDVEAINQRELEALGGREEKFEAQDSNPQTSRTLDTLCPVGQLIVLKVGAQVIKFYLLLMVGVVIKRA